MQLLIGPRATHLPLKWLNNIWHISYTANIVKLFISNATDNGHHSRTMTITATERRALVKIRVFTFRVCLNSKVNDQRSMCSFVPRSIIDFFVPVLIFDSLVRLSLSFRWWLHMTGAIPPTLSRQLLSIVLIDIAIVSNSFNSTFIISPNSALTTSSLLSHSIVSIFHILYMVGTDVVLYKCCKKLIDFYK